MPEGRIELMVPVGKANVKEEPIASRPSGLDGRVLGVLCNRKHNADLLLGRLVENLSGRYDFSGTVYREKEAAAPAPETILDELKETCDFVLNAAGD
jgi:hypothetical protein